MAKVDLSTLSVEQLETALRGRKNLQFVVLGIFGVIVVAWLVLGFWRENLPVFISTVVVALGTSASLHAATQGVRTELQRRAMGGERAVSRQE